MISSDEFEKIVGEALDSLPERFASLIENVAVTVEEEPSAADRALLGDGRELLGVFRGVPLTARSFGLLPSLPNRVVIFRGPILRVTRTREEALRQIRETVVHELGHYFGLDDHTMAF